jgi:hypothetical protein
LNRIKLLPYLLALTACTPQSFQLLARAGTDPRPAYLTERGDLSRNGANLNETQLTAGNVGTGQFGKRFARAVDGQIYAQPLYVPQLTLADGVHDVVFVATEHNSVYAFDASDAGHAEPLWQKNFGPPLAATAIDCTDITPEIGITATPVIDPATSTMYVAAKTLENSTAVYRLHAIDIRTGSEQPGSPVEIAATVPGTGEGSSHGMLPFGPRLQLGRTGLALAGGKVVLAFGSHCDIDPYHGWIFAYDATSLARVAAYTNTPNGSEGGIWHAGVAPPVDDDGNFYFASGNGTFTGPADGAAANLDHVDLGDTVSRVRIDDTGVHVLDFFTPFDQQQLSDEDADLGTAGVALLPGTPFAITGGKAGVLYLMRRTALGGFDPARDRVAQRIVAGESQMVGAPVFWRGPAQTFLFVQPQSEALEAFPFATDHFSVAGRRSNPNIVSQPRGSMIVLSSDGQAGGTGILWIALADPNDATSCVLHAVSAEDITHELWNSEQNPKRDRVGGLAKYAPPTVVDGKVFMATSSGQLQVYGLLP